MRSIVALALACAALLCAAPASAHPWLFVSDIHLNPVSRDPRPAPLGIDTNPPLLESAIAAMRRVAPDPPVVVIDGDFLAHNFDYSRAVVTMQRLARRFDRAYPHAQFVISLGNEDSGCGDYQLGTDSPFLQAVARAWEPLVNRHGAAPRFEQTFARDGFYTASLPVAGLRAVVIDDVSWSPRFRPCPGDASNAGDVMLAELQGALAQGPPRGRAWVFAHIPPGIDAFSTVYFVRRFAVVPFLEPARRDAFLAAAEAPAHRVALVVTAHAHKFSYRIGDVQSAHPVPFFMVPSISPVFGNAPSFLTVDVASDGTVTNAVETSYLNGTWQRIGDLRGLGVRAFTAPALVDLQARLTRDPALRRRYARLYQGGARPEITDRTWSAYRCAAIAFTSTAFRDCSQIGGFSFITGRGVFFGSILVAVALAVAVATVLAVRRVRARRRR